MGREAALAFAREGALVVGCGLYIEDAEATVAAVRAAGGTMVSMQPCDLLQRSSHKPRSMSLVGDVLGHTNHDLAV